MRQAWMLGGFVAQHGHIPNNTLGLVGWPLCEHSPWPATCRMPSEPRFYDDPRSPPPAPGPVEPAADRRHYQRGPRRLVGLPPGPGRTIAEGRRTTATARPGPATAGGPLPRAAGCAGIGSGATPGAIGPLPRYRLPRAGPQAGASQWS